MQRPSKVEIRLPTTTEEEEQRSIICRAGNRAGGNACNQTEVGHNSLRILIDNTNFSEMHCQMSRKMGRGKSTT